jgi:hypothetical protein
MGHPKQALGAKQHRHARYSPVNEAPDMTRTPQSERQRETKLMKRPEPYRKGMTPGKSPHQKGKTAR